MTGRRLLAAALVVWSAVALLAVRPAAADLAGSSGVQLLAQTASLVGSGVYDFRVSVAAPPTGRIQVAVFPQLHTRTDFDNAAAGHVNGYFHQEVLSLAKLHPDLAGGYDISLPVNEAALAGDPFGPVQIGETGVFPVQIAVFDASGTPQGPPLTTFIVFAQHAESAGAITPLAAAVILPFATPISVSPAGALTGPSPAEATRLDQLATVLNEDSSVPASILADPTTLDRLAGDRTATGDLAGATSASGPFEILPSTYSPVSVGDLESAGLGAEVQPQLDAGAQTLRSTFGVGPDASTWAVDGPVDCTTISALSAHHVTQIVVPDSDLSPVANAFGLTFGGSTYLDCPNTQMPNTQMPNTQITVIGADTTLTSDFTRIASPVLAANVLLAELAMIYTELPNSNPPRGVAVMPPAVWSASPDFVQTLLSGLDNNPVVSAVTASSLFAAVKAPVGRRTLTAPFATEPGYGSLQSASPAITTARGAIRDLQSVFGSSPQVGQLNKDLLVAESETLTGRERPSVLGVISKATGQILHTASLPPATSITLTSTKGQIPITILAAGNLHPKVQLRLRSQRLIFRPFAPREGTCTVQTDTAEEVCNLSLTAQNTTLNVPVESRSSGVFPLDVYLYGGSKPLAHDQDTVRSTAVSSAAVILIVLALVALVLWWGRDLRRGRRPKGMVPSPVAEPGTVSGGTDLDAFFDRPPPDFDGRDGAMSPSGTRPGPSRTTEGYGQAGRETGE
jgi:hypothetical protein